ncbi:hypothetical protein ANTHELSMS3_01053 [Antarctobacter heliothermus]|uniref:HEAT repeat domain-containing protein n=1 Tax=Antarctobacter heliothermus TaxID=74033 RepID=A0A222E0N1_9RHOB|nr:hypothetical protein [Antarctobacter heliothermus]ASP19769.1 hypothetical protein ANTHELSMS3_01053 [Antarctobacter heliothermus]
MTRWIFWLLILLLPTVTAAQTVTVRSGEHGEFTRLVLDVPDGTDWELIPDQEAARVTLSLGSGPYEFDTSTVFNRIGTERIAGLTPSADGRGLDIGLSCQCGAEAFVLRGTMLVIDIAPSDPLAQIASSRAVWRESETTDPVRSPLLREFAQIRFGDAPQIGPQSEDARRLPYFADSVAEDLVSSILNSRDGGPSASRDLGNQLAADLAVAATQGLLDPAIRSPAAPIQVEDRQPDPVIPDELSIDPGTLARRLAVGLSGLDHQALQNGRISVGGEVCVHDRDLAIGSWSQADDDPNVILAERRGKVFGEFDRIGSKFLRQYATSLLYYGFGAEARSALSLQPEMQAPTLVALSYVVDGEPDPTGLFDGLAGCDGAAALWSVLSLPPSPDAPKISAAAILRNFETLPKHLRSHLGPKLVDHLSRSGYSDVAKDVLRRLQRMEGEETDSIALGKAQLALKEGRHGEAGKRLHDLSVAGGPEAAKAVAAAIELADATDTPVPTRIVELSDAFATELRNTEDGQKLWKSHVRSLLINGAFDAAFAEFDAPHGMPPEVVAFMQQVALKFLVERADDLTFLKLATLSLADGLHPDQSATGINIAERFLSLGLPDIALEQLVVTTDENNLPESRTARAAALLALSRPAEAEIILIGQRGDRVVRLRAEARRQMGDHVFTKAIYESIGDGPAAVDAAWLSGDWEDVAESDTALAPAAGLMQTTPVAFDASDLTLSAANTLSAASAHSRETLRALLDATSVPIED